VTSAADPEEVRTVIVVPNVAADVLLDDLIEAIDTYYHLYVNAATLGPDTTLTDLTEAAWPDYRSMRVTTWSPAIALEGTAASQADPVVWVRGVGGLAVDVYGYYVTDGATGPLLWVEARPSGPTPMRAATDTVIVTPQLTLRQNDCPPTS
jgi:hypothetical protein